MVRIFKSLWSRLQPNDGRVISNLMMQALGGEPLTIYGDGSQTRSFCYVSDLIEGIVRLANSDEALPVNIGNPTEWTILECAKEVQALVGSRCEICISAAAAGRSSRDSRTSQRRQKLLGWEPGVSAARGAGIVGGVFQEASE